MNLTFDLEKLTVGDLATIEEVAGGDAFALLAAGGAPDAKTLLGLVLVVLRKDDPEATLEDARAVPLSSIASTTPTEPGPTSAAG